jgi:hypothetical protein
MGNRSGRFRALPMLTVSAPRDPYSLVLDALAACRGPSRLVHLKFGLRAAFLCALLRCDPPGAMTERAPS